MQEGCKKFCGIIRTLADYIAEYGGKYKKILRDTVAEELQTILTAVAVHIYLDSWVVYSLEPVQRSTCWHVHNSTECTDCVGDISILKTIPLWGGGIIF